MISQERAGNYRRRFPKNQSGVTRAASGRARERVVFVCFVHVRNICWNVHLKLQYVQVFTYRMLTIKYYILQIMLMRHEIPFVQHLVFLK